MHIVYSIVYIPFSSSTYAISLLLFLELIQILAASFPAYHGKLKGRGKKCLLPISYNIPTGTMY